MDLNGQTGEPTTAIPDGANPPHYLLSQRQTWDVPSHTPRMRHKELAFMANAWRVYCSFSNDFPSTGHDKLETLFGRIAGGKNPHLHLRHLKATLLWQDSLKILKESIHKETIMHGHDRHNTTILSVIHNMSTTCFGQYYFCFFFLRGHHEVL